MEGMEAARTPPEAKASRAASAHSSAVLEEVFAFAIPIGIDYTRRSGCIAPYRSVWCRARVSAPFAIDERSGAAFAQVPSRISVDLVPRP